MAEDASPFDSMPLGNLESVDAPVSLDAPLSSVPPPEQEQDLQAPLSGGSEHDVLEVKGEPAVDEGPTPQMEWEAKHDEILRARKEKEDQAKAEIVEKARQELEEFYKRRNDRIQKTKDNNRLEEKTKTEEQNQVMAHGQTWEKASRFVNLGARANEKRDVDRMRRLFVQMKNAPQAAGGAQAGAAAAGPQAASPDLFAGANSPPQ